GYFSRQGSLCLWPGAGTVVTLVHVAEDRPSRPAARHRHHAEAAPGSVLRPAADHHRAACLSEAANRATLLTASRHTPPLPGGGRQHDPRTASSCAWYTESVLFWCFFGSWCWLIYS